MTTSVGILGAGQLGRMLALAGYPLGLRFCFLDPEAHPPAGELAPHTAKPYPDPEALADLARCDVVTYEFENVPENVVRALSTNVPVWPPPQALRVAQDRYLEKTCFQELGIPTPRFAAVETLVEFDTALHQLGTPAVLKTRRFGYDGKGQRVIRTPREAPAAWKALSGVPLILEEFVRFDRELSLLAVRSSTGEVRFYPLVQNQHEDGILRVTRAPAPALSAELQATAQRYGEQLLERLDYVGVLALELFEAQGQLLANEIAPRVHNSGHWTIEGARTSQFENHLRAITGLPLGATEALGPCAMLNLIGDVPDPARVLELPDTHLHLYGKTPRPGRKLGHITVRAADEPDLERAIQRLSALIRPVVDPR